MKDRSYHSAAKLSAVAINPEFAAVETGEHSDPFSVLGPHWVASANGRKSLAIRVFRPSASEVSIIWSGTENAYPGVAVKGVPGLFEAVLPAGLPRLEEGEPVAPDLYRVRIKFHDGNVFEAFDTYSFPPLLTEFDLYLSGEGTDYLKYDKFGAHLRELSGVKGVHFAVWAPNAKRVGVVGDFNAWDGRVHAMRSRGASGVWEIFIPSLGEGTLYKYEILSTVGDHLVLKSDPFAFGGELRPRTASRVADIDHYEWHDSKWSQARAAQDWMHAPMSIYEVHPGSWRRRTAEGYRWLSYRELADELIPYVRQMEFTHIELLPIMEHPLDASWGYQTVGYYAVSSRFGSPTDFMYFVDECHKAGLGVILDWTPAHFPRDAHGLAFFDGTHLYEHEDPRLGSHPDWGTLVFNYGRNEVRNFLLANALFWLDKYHVDALRVDAVASMLYLDYSRQPGQWVPNRHGGRENLEAIDFLKRLNEVLHNRFPGTLTIAEESTAWPAVSRPTYLGGLGFDLKWNMGWMNDTLRYFALDPIHRQYHQGELTFSMIYAFHENFVLPLSHDEIVHGKRALLEKMPGDDWQKFANLRLLFAYMFAHPGKKLLFMGGELAQRDEWWEGGSLDWSLEASPPHRGVQRLLADLNRLHRTDPALYEIDFEPPGFEWIDPNDAAASALTFMRRGRTQEQFVVVVCNFTPVVREEYRVGVPGPGYYKEILNTDSNYYEGSNIGNSGGVLADPIPWNGRPWSIALRLPPLAALYFKLQT
ncbi:MAG TPA: 1,4-alpha-glucan branching protein GlgB [Verrucomicrobiae bacterium]|nr:1,4-alpha-glucan branching protein GlgB [Verrucomicrobiae bacterium]